LTKPKAIELDPAYAQPWNGLGNLLADELKRFDEAEAAYRKAIELDPAHAVAWNGLGFLLGEEFNRVDEAENAYRRALELDPDDPWTWINVGILLDAQDRLDEAAVAYSRGATLGAEVYPYWRKRRCDLMTRRYTSAARRALDAGDLPALREALGSLLAGADGIATILVSESFVEGFLALVLADRHGTALLAVLRELGFEKHARPLLLALEAAIENRADKLAELEPEVSAAAQQMFERLNRASDRSQSE
jgi:tetratricopeptide (TPR) repeat protein